MRSVLLVALACVLGALVLLALTRPPDAGDEPGDRPEASARAEGAAAPAGEPGQRAPEDGAAAESEAADRPERWRVRGRVVAPDGSPVPSAEVILCDPWSTVGPPTDDLDELFRWVHRATTDGVGRFAFDVSPPQIRVIDAEERIFLVARTTEGVAVARVVAQRSEDVEVVLGSPVHLEVEAVDGAGGPLDALRIHASVRTDAEDHDSLGLTVETDEQGRARFPSLPREGIHCIELTAEREDLLPFRRILEGGPAAGVVRLVLTRGLRVRGIAREPDGRPAARLPIDVSRRLSPWEVDPQFSLEPKGRTGLDGRFEVIAVPLEAGVLCFGSPPRYVEGFRGPEGATVDLGDVTLARRDVIRGVVLDREERPLAGVSVRALHLLDETILARAVTGPDGWFTLEDLPEVPAPASRDIVLPLLIAASGQDEDGPWEVEYEDKVEVGTQDVVLRRPDPEPSKEDR